MSENWDFYQCNVNHKPASVALYLDLKDGAPDARRPTLVVVCLNLRYPHPVNGMSTDAEFKVLSEMEDRLDEAFKQAYGAVQAGRITTDGRRDFYYYAAAAPGLDALVVSAWSPFPGYAWRTLSQDDPHWHEYLHVLYPDGAALRWMKDRSVIEALRNAGDVADLVRPITHYSYFPNATSRATFATAIEKAGFTVRRLSEPGSAAAARPYGLIYELAQLPELGAMAETTTLLTRLAEQGGGEYDGWESPVTGRKARPWWRFWQ